MKLPDMTVQFEVRERRKGRKACVGLEQHTLIKETWLSCMIFIYIYIFILRFLYMFRQTSFVRFLYSELVQWRSSDFSKTSPADSPIYLKQEKLSEMTHFDNVNWFYLYLPFPFTVYLGCNIWIEMAEQIMLCY